MPRLCFPSAVFAEISLSAMLEAEQVLVMFLCVCVCQSGGVTYKLLFAMFYLFFSPLEVPWLNL